MSIAEKLTTIAENEQRVYNAGMSKAERDFWDGFTNKNQREIYNKAFTQSGFSYIRPPYAIKPKNNQSLAITFSNSEKLIKVESAAFDFSTMELYTGTAEHYGAYWTFEGCFALEEVEDIGLPAVNSYTATFANCKKLHTIAIVRSAQNTVFADNAFKNCPLLENISFDGVIASAINLSWSPLLTHDSLMSVINHLATVSTTKTLTIGTTNLAKLTDAEKAIATQKGWTLA